MINSLIDTIYVSMIFLSVSSSLIKPVERGERMITKVLDLNSLFVVDPNGNFSKNKFQFDPEKFMLKFYIHKNKFSCSASLYYSSDSKKRIVFRKDDLRKKRKLKRGDLCLNIQKGQTVLTSIALPCYENSIKIINKIRKGEIIGLRKIKKFFQSVAGNDDFKILFDDQHYFLTFYKYPFAQMMPGRIKSFVADKEKKMNIKIDDYLESVKSNPPFKLSNSFYIDQQKKKFLNQYQNWKSELSSLCKEHDLFEGNSF